MIILVVYLARLQGININANLRTLFLGEFNYRKLAHFLANFSKRGNLSPKIAAPQKPQNRHQLTINKPRQLTPPRRTSTLPGNARKNFRAPDHLYHTARHPASWHPGSRIETSPSDKNKDKPAESAKYRHHIYHHLPPYIRYHFSLIPYNEEAR